MFVTDKSPPDLPTISVSAKFYGLCVAGTMFSSLFSFVTEGEFRSLAFFLLCAYVVLYGAMLWRWEREILDFRNKSVDYALSIIRKIGWDH